MKADRRGRLVGSSIGEYERVSSYGRDRLAETLISRHTLRMDRIPAMSDYYRLPILSSLAPIALLDMFLRHAGADPRRHPSAYIGDWPDHLAWAVDSAVAAARLLLCGQVVGAAAVARNQLERWTFHRAQNAGLTQGHGESTLDYVARVWSSDDHFHEHWFAGDADDELVADDEDPGSTEEPSSDHRHVRKSDGTEICPAVLYGFLSEIMHARLLPEAIAWDSEKLLRDDDWPPDVSVALGAIADTITLCLRQVRVAAASLAEQLGDGPGLSMLSTPFDGFSEPESTSTPDASDSTDSAGANEPAAGNGQLASPPPQALIPLLPEEGLDPAILKPVYEMAAVFVATMNGQRPAGRLFRDDELVMYAFGWHRARSAGAARWAMELERRQHGDKFDPEALQSRSTRWILLTEATSLISLWHRQKGVASAAALVSSGLRSAYWLWLEDDDRAMSVLRCVLEQLARVRTWRLKPDKAQLLESRPQTTPRDWLEAAGWKRLTALNRALGEFAHTQPTSRWSGARELLAKLQLDVDPEKAIFTARGASLEFVSNLAAQEVTASMKDLSGVVATVLDELLDSIGFETSEGTGPIEARFNHIWTLRTASLGDSDFDFLSKQTVNEAP